MAIETAIIVDDRDERLGTLQVGPACFVLNYDGRYFYRTDKRKRLMMHGTATGVVFEETEVWIRARLNP
jgi:hypothetical protein